MSFDNSTNLVTLDGTVHSIGEYTGGCSFPFMLQHDYWCIVVRAVGEEYFIRHAYEQLKVGQSVRVSGELGCIQYKKDDFVITSAYIESKSITIKEEPKEEHFDEETMKAFLKEARMG